MFIHKNNLADIFLVGGEKGLKQSKIGKEKYIRWIDIPEQVEIKDKLSSKDGVTLRGILIDIVDEMFTFGRFISEDRAKALYKKINNIRQLSLDNR